MDVSFAGQTLAERVGERSIRQRDQLLADQLLNALRQREILFDRVADLGGTTHRVVSTTVLGLGNAHRRNTQKGHARHLSHTNDGLQKL